MTRDDLDRLRALLGDRERAHGRLPVLKTGREVDGVETEHFRFNRAAADFRRALIENAPALLDAAERGLDDGLRFGPWFEGERHAVAADGGRYTIAAAPEGFYFTAPPHNEPCPCESGTRATESEAIEAARAHDRARRAKGG